MVTEMTSDTQYLSPRDFARLIGISESSLAKARMRGDGPEYVKIGNQYVTRERQAWLGWPPTPGAAPATRSVARPSGLLAS